MEKQKCLVCSQELQEEGYCDYCALVTKIKAKNNDDIFVTTVFQIEIDILNKLIDISSSVSLSLTSFINAVLIEYISNFQEEENDKNKKEIKESET